MAKSTILKGEICLSGFGSFFLALFVGHGVITTSERSRTTSGLLHSQLG
jgi:hypothetical protein